MPILDDIRTERKKIRNKSLKQKFSYFWTYYKAYFIVAVLIAALVSTFVFKRKEPEIILSGSMLNVFVKTDQASPEEKIANEFRKYYEYDPRKKSIELNTALFYVANSKNETYENYQTMQSLLTKTAVGKLDFITGDIQTMLELTYNGFFFDLREVLSKEQIEKFEPYILYADKFVMDKKNEKSSLDSGLSIDIPDCRSPDKMVEPIPILIDISKSKIINETYNYSNDTISLGISGNRNTEIMNYFLDFIILQ